MSIRFACQHCQSKLNVSDKFAGKRVKCPKCTKPIQVPDAAGPTVQPAAPSDGGWGSTSRTHLDDLLDEAGVKTAPEGPACPECGAPIEEGAVLCVECGYNFELGRRLSTFHEEEEEGLSEHEKILRKAEREIDLSPQSSEDSDFGDGPASFFIAIAAVLGGGAILGVILTTIFFADLIAANLFSQAVLAMSVGSLFFVIGFAWITVAAFFDAPGHGIICLLCWVYAVIYGFTQLKSLAIPTMLLCVGWLALFAGGIMLQFAE